MEDVSDLTTQDATNLELTKIVKNLALLGKQIQKSFYKRPTNNNLCTTSAPTAINKRQDVLLRGEVMRQGSQRTEKNEVVQEFQEQNTLDAVNKVTLQGTVQRPHLFIRINRHEQ